VLEAEGSPSVRRQRAGHLLDRAHRRRPVQPRRHHPHATCATTPLRRRRIATFGARPRPSSAAPGGHRRAPSTCAPTSSTSSRPGDRLTVDLRNTDEADPAGGRAPASPTSSPRSPSDEGSRSPTARLARFEPVVVRPGRIVDLVEPPPRPGSHGRLPSGAGHDAQMLARVCPRHDLHPQPTGASATTRPSTPTRPTSSRGRRAAAHDAPARVWPTRDRRTPTIPTRPPRTPGPDRDDRGRAAQIGPIAAGRDRASVVDRLIALCSRGATANVRAGRVPRAGAHHLLPPLVHRERPDRDRQLLRDRDARPRDQAPVRRGGRPRHRLLLGYAELTPDGHRYNTTILVERDGSVVGHYRKVHLPGHEEYEPWRRSSTSSGATSSPATASGVAGVRRRRRGWPPATTGAGPRPTGCLACRAPS
jgi:hypothetical protein